MAEVTGPQTGIKIKTQDASGFVKTGDNGDNIYKSLPGPAGSGYSTFKTAYDAVKDADISTGDISSIAASGASFVSSCMSVSGIATDPIGWVVGQGLNFLISVVQPIQDAGTGAPSSRQPMARYLFIPSTR